MMLGESTVLNLCLSGIGWVGADASSDFSGMRRDIPHQVKVNQGSQGNCMNGQVGLLPCQGGVPWVGRLPSSAHTAHIWM